MIVSTMASNNNNNNYYHYEYSPSRLQAQIAFGVIATVGAAVCTVILLLQIEQSRVLHAIADGDDLDDDGVSTASEYHVENDLELHDETGCHQDNNDNHSIASHASSKAKEVIQRAGSRLRRRHNFEYWVSVILPTSLTAVLILLIYLLLVFLPSGLGLSILGVVSIALILLRSYIYEELRRSRLDRLAAILTFFLVIASMLSLVTYARLTLKAGYIYQGRARIVGHDETKYSDGKEDYFRTDLLVAWGGSWGCPFDDASKQCQAMVSGALCEIKSNDDERRRRLLDTKRSLSYERTQDDNYDDYYEIQQMWKWRAEKKKQKELANTSPTAQRTREESENDASNWIQDMITESADQYKNTLDQYEQAVNEYSEAVQEAIDNATKEGTNASSTPQQQDNVYGQNVQEAIQSATAEQNNEVLSFLTQNATTSPSIKNDTLENDDGKFQRFLLC